MTDITQQFKDLALFKVDPVAGAVKAMQKETGAKSQDLYIVPVDQIKVREGYNPRIETPLSRLKDRELVESFKQNGFYKDKPLGVIVVAEDGKNVPYLEDGHRRYKNLLVANAELLAEGKATIDAVPLIVLPSSMTAEQRLVHMVRSNNDGLPFNPMELAIIVQRMVGFGKDDEQIGVELGMTRTYVRQLKSLAGSPKAIRDMVVNGDISATLAIETLAEHKEEAAPLLEEAVKESKATGKKTTAKAVKKAAATKKAGKPKPTKAELDAKSLRLQKKHATEAFDLLQRVFNKNGKHIDNEFHTEVDALFVQCGVIG